MQVAIRLKATLSGDNYSSCRPTIVIPGTVGTGGEVWVGTATIRIPGLG